ncbi:ATP-binding protein [Chitinophaga caseinilytica]|uniref:ATP-binding protein n=1 Tax=Chitinophaga caseinilytica TaxID=2267521 RepID=UPI003C30405A
MGKKFVVDARTIIHLGRESIKDHTTALIELVKNGYDADANVVEIEIYKQSTFNKIRVADDGDGMTEKEMDDNWLRIGHSHKRSSKQTTKKHRRKTGEKGIGRLSTDRLGKNLEIKSISSDGIPHGLKIDWELFNQDGMEVSSIDLDPLENPKVCLPEEAKTNTGTELIITNLRANWTQENIQNLYNELAILTPPFKEIIDFEIYLKNDVAPEFNGKVAPTALLKPEIEIELDYDGLSYDLIYSIKDRFDPDNPITEVTSWQNLMQKVIDPFDYPFTQKLLCGPVKVKLLLYPRTKALAEGTNFKLSELREYVDKNVGVKIYRDNISVKPYGFLNVQYGGDWLGLAERHSRNPAGLDRPEYRVVANQLVGAVFIERDANPLLIDSASREGLVENEGFYDLRALVLGTLALLENRRYQIYQNQKKGGTAKPTPTEQSEIFKDKIDVLKQEVQSLKKIGTDLAESQQLRESIQHIEEFIQDSIQTSKSFEELLNHNRVLAGLATLGIAAAVFGHETQGAISEFNNAAKLAKEFIEEAPEEIEIVLDELAKAIKYGDQVSAWGAFALSRVQKEKRKRENKPIDQIIHRVVKEIQVVFDAVDIQIEYNLDGIFAKVYPMDIESIVINIITNAYTACLQQADNRKIRIELKSSTIDDVDGFSLSIANSGPPIDMTLAAWIWEPLNTLKKDSTGKEIGTGLGLTIVKSIVDALKGDAKVFNDNVLGGALFQIWLPLNLK